MHDLENSLGALAVALLDRQRRALTEESELDEAELAGLLAVHARRGSTVTDVATTVGLTHSGAVRLVDRLERAGAITRKRGADRRAAALETTPAGDALARQALARRRNALTSLLAPLSAGERDALAGILDRLLPGFAEDRAAAWRICRYCEHDRCRGADCPVGGAVP